MLFFLFMILGAAGDLTKFGVLLSNIFLNCIILLLLLLSSLLLLILLLLNGVLGILSLLSLSLLLL